jgi:hypothetical protein
MSEVEIPEEVRALLYDRIHTYEQLETVILLFRRSGQLWTAAMVSAELKIPMEAAREALQGLAAQGVLRVTPEVPTLRYDWKPELQPIVDNLIRVYDENRLELMSIMSTNAIERMRTGALRAFANAFVFGRKRDDG